MHLLITSREKIQKSPTNYHRFSGWHSKLPKLGFRPPKLPDTCILAPFVSFGRLTGRKPSHVQVTWFIFPKKPEFTPLPTDWNFENGLRSFNSLTEKIINKIYGFITIMPFSKNRIQDSQILGFASFLTLLTLTPLLRWSTLSEGRRRAILEGTLPNLFRILYVDGCFVREISSEYCM